MESTKNTKSGESRNLSKLITMISERQRIDWGITSPPLRIDRSVFVKTDQEKSKLATLKAQYKRKMKDSYSNWESTHYTQRAVVTN